MSAAILAANEFVAPEINWVPLIPFMIIAGAGVVGVLVEAFAPEARRRMIQIVLTLAAQVAALISLFVVVSKYSTELDEAGIVAVINHSVLFDTLTIPLMVIILICSILATLVMIDRTSAKQDPFAPTAAAIPGSEYESLARARGLEQTEVFPLFLFALTGMLVFPAAGDFITMFVALEVLSLPLYVLTAMARRRRLLSQEAAFKYFVTGSFASALFLFGAALTYGATGSVQLGFVAQRAAQLGQAEGNYILLYLVGMVLILAGVLFKMGAVPFQAWTPDVYQGAPTAITAFMAAGTKIAAVGVLIRVVYSLISAAGVDGSNALIKALWIVAIATMLVGTIAGLTQTDIKRMLAYSSIGHAGFVLVGLIGIKTFTVDEVLFYLLAYGITTVGAFAVVTLVREVTPTGEVLGEANHIGQWAGLGKRSPFVAGVFSLFLLSFAGIPLTAGFIAKFEAFSAAAEGGALPLVLVGVVASAISLFFYIRVIVLMYFVPTVEDRGEELAVAAPNSADPAEDDREIVELAADEAPVRTSVVVMESATGVEVVKSSGPILAVIILAAAFVIGAGVFPGPVLDMIAGLFS